MSDPRTDADFMAANPSDQMRYLAAVDPDFAKASPVDQLGYLAHIHGVGSVSGPQLPSVEPVDVFGSASGSGAGMSKVPRSIQTSPNWVGDAIAGTAGAGAAAMGAAPVVSAAMPTVAKMLAKHPILGPMIASEVISKARSIPYVGKLVPPYAEMLPWLVGKGEPAEATPNEPAPFPEKPPEELLQANALSKGPPQPPPEAAALKTIPTPTSSPATATAAAAETPAAVTPGAAESIPRTLSGESALRQVLTGQDNANLLKIARSRGINVTAESQLKPGVADNRLINKIIDDFSDDELDNLRSTFLQNANKHQFGDIGPEAWKTMSLQTYFPDVKIPTAVLKRTAAATNKPAMTPPAGYQPGGPGAAATSDDLTDLLQQSVAAAKKARPAASQ